MQPEPLAEQRVSFQHPRSATAVAQAGLARVEREHDFVAWFQFISVSCGCEVFSGEIKRGGRYGSILSDHQKTSPRTICDRRPAHVLLVAGLLWMSVRHVLVLDRARPQPHICAFFPIGIVLLRTPA